MSNERTYTVAELATLADDSWLNGSLEAHVLKVETVPKKAGGNFWKLLLSDGGAEPLASMSMFAAPKAQAGDDIRLSGSGIKKTSYQGKAQVGTGKETKVDIRPGRPAVMAAAQGAIAEKQNGELVNGQSAGMAIKLALDLLTHNMPMQERVEQFTAPGFWRRIHVLASDIVRVARLLEKGSLADPVSTRGGAPRQQAPQSRPPVQPQHNPEQELDEFVPF